MPRSPTPDLAFFLAADTHDALCAWLLELQDLRRASAHTVAAYGSDARACLAFLAGHLGAPPNLADLAATSLADWRSYLAHATTGGLGRPAAPGHWPPCVALPVGSSANAAWPFRPWPCCVRRAFPVRCLAL